MGYTLKDVVGATLTNYEECLEGITLSFDNGRKVDVWPLPGSRTGLRVYPSTDCLVGQKIIKIKFGMSADEEIYNESESAHPDAIYSCCLTFMSAAQEARIRAFSPNVPAELQAVRNYSVY